MPYRVVVKGKEQLFNSLSEYVPDSRLDVSVIIPTYNEEGNIERLIKSVSHALQDWHFEIVVVDDASKDKTQEIMDIYSAKSVVTSVHRTGIRGIFSAIRDGIYVARGRNIVIMDADFSHPPELIHEFMKFEKEYDLISGSRFAKGGGLNAPFSRKYPTFFLNAAVRIMLGKYVTDWTGGFHLINKEKFSAIEFKYPSVWGEFDLELLYRAKKSKLKVKELPFVYNFREEGESKSADTPFKFLAYGARYFFRALRLRLFN